MTKQKSTKRALLLSALSLLMCVSMLIGSTFAWFTDSVTTGSNIIKSGNLDIVLEYQKADGTWADAEGKILDWIKAPGAESEAILWEPGCTYKLPALRVRNNGNLALKYTIVVNGIVGDAKLLEAIEFTANDAAIETFKGELLTKDAASAPIVIKGHMKESAGNEYKDLTLNGISVAVCATQLTHENDSFGPDYDKDAAWDGTIPATMPETLVVDGQTQTVHIKDAAAFAYLSTLSANWADLYTDGNGKDYINYANGKGAQYYYSDQWTISLETDINLLNQPIDPVVVVLGQGTGNSKFEGNGHTISNINATSGLFADGNRCAYNDFTLANVTINNGKNNNAGALAAFNRSALNNINVINATVNGCKYVGGIVGTQYGSVTNCSVTNSTIIASNKTAGGLVGYAVATSTPASISGNKVENVKVTGTWNVGGMLGQAQNVNVDGNTVKNVTVTSTKELPADASANEVRCAEVAARSAFASTTIGANTVENVTLVKAISTADELASSLKTAASAGAGDSTFALTDDIDMSGSAWTPISVDGYHGAGVITIEGNGATIKGLDAPLFKGGFAGKSGIVIKNLTIADSSIVSTSGLGGGAFIDTADSMHVITLENCHLVNSTVSGERTGGLIGWCSGYAKLNDGPVKAYVTISNCSVVDSKIIAAGSAGAIAGHPGASDYTYTTIENCKVNNVDVISNDSGTWRTGAVVGTANNGHIVINNVTVKDVTLTQNGVTNSETVMYGRFVPSGTGTLVIDGVEIK